MAYIVSLIAAMMMTTIGAAIIFTMDWRAKIAITPWFISGLIYLVYTYGPYPMESADTVCQLLDSIGIITILWYTVWNRRCKDGRQESKKAHEKEKNPKPQKMKAVDTDYWLW